ncbi:GNAT family acetyltransferase [Flavobacterium enshiense DK69]|uniref:GNAT family acetyltransferase n=1 Tax=Flavobacterium enshiense DK69 TaxID=1107311 RepID=V6RZD9_9FLAO|nr:GNAT family protein [Flavobacterium enshiense]ESU19836.1 GNAT family acetyltransferase [Flavobacterium enshiense DK69]KGO93129.1 GNAT family acetyltransferase [Flavobacterium enshiense DK69]
MTNNWINHPVVLKGDEIELLPLEKEHFEDLFLAASNKEIWELTSVDYSVDEIFYPNFNGAMKDREKGTVYPFIIIHKNSNKIIGTTRFLEIYPNDKKIEIGVTWIMKEYWGTTVNLECKLLLLNYCFENLKTNRVQFRAKDNNVRSRKAIQKIGGIFEGVLRKDKIEPNGIPRNTAFYSILDSEWEDVKQSIKNQIEIKAYR